ncbi:16S rRNA (guanine(966)-N(2))-methyltransferase RsmD [Buchnera aphidicola]|uniref:Ribosomal RNA small subunit methyltransferase D n=1 Tax=Buchnera aphidicola (Anoecia oenotherae) TaxID=1241833 RepID=A0A4D6Y3Z2_9GAMM|nr:16S rRNA (guanine(966)-N(2))-methyltransferase RsmD [Buchnera aphidicola]QCI19165.1 16S rRNA (guanine(966)-N(2))-methyltransferase RsmD [Buchnera aphidicola (Anoecia oenotherae)]
MKKLKILKNFKKYPKKIRIISGKFRSRIIKLPSFSYNLRPTTSNMRETLFNWLNIVIQDSVCLDCFSGTGALSIESVSRGAKSVTSLEINKNLVNNIKKCLRLISISNIKTICINSTIWLRKRNIKKKFDIVFVDPPFYQGLVQMIINLLEEYNWLKKKSYIYIERENINTNLIIPNCWILYKNKVSKNVIYSLYIRC